MSRRCTKTEAGQQTGRTTTYTYDLFGRVLHDHNAAGTIANTYNATMPCLDNVVDRAGTETDYTCNSAGDILTTSVVVPAVAGTKQLTAQTRTTTTTYNALGQVQTVTQPGQSQATVSTYYANNLLKDTTDPLGRVTSFDYNPAGWMTQKTLPVDQAPNQPLVLTYAYDAAGNQTVVTKAVGAANFSWTTAYDAQNRVTSTTTPGVSTPTTYQYDQVAGYLASDAGFLSSSVTDPAGVKTLTGVDLLGRTKDVQVGVQTGGGPGPTETHYTSQGTLDTITDPTGVVTKYTFDDFGEQLSSSMVTDPDGVTFRSTSQTYDSVGRVATSTDQRGYVTTFGYDGDGRVTSVQPSGVAQANQWQFVYDAAGDRVETIDPNAHKRDWAYDVMGRTINAYEYPQTGTTLTTGYHYDADSQLVSVDDPRGFVLCYTYDGLGNRLSRYKAATTCSGAQSQTESWTYSPLSGMTGAVESGGASVSVGYDAANPERLASVTEGSASTTYAYAAANGRLSSVTDPAGQTSYGYDSQTGRVATITDPFTGLAKTAYTYDGAGRVLSRTDTAGLTLTNTYDAAGRLSSAVTKTPANAVVSSYGYTYDSASNVTGYSQTLPTVSGQANPDSGTWAYTYNQREELATAKLGSNPTLTYTYYDSGDRQTVQVGAGTPTTTTYDGADRVQTVGSTSYTWDAADQLTNVGAGRTYAYDAWGRTTSATVGATTVGYAYDALDRTMSRTPSSGSATTYAYTGLGQSIASATTGAAQPVLLAYRQEGPMAQKQASTVRAYEQNPHGDLSVITDMSGVATGTISYDPWGTVDAAIGTDAQQSLLGYQSQPTDPTTGLTDMGTRLYDPSMARFTERDVVFGTLTSPLTLNQYVYGNDNPMVYSDPTGMYGAANIDGNNASGALLAGGPRGRQYAAAATQITYSTAASDGWESPALAQRAYALHFAHSATKPVPFPPLPLGVGRSPRSGIAVGGSFHQEYELPNATLFASFTVYGTVGSRQAEIGWLYSRSSVFQLLTSAAEFSLSGDTSGRADAVVRGSNLESQWGSLKVDTSVSDGLVGGFHSAPVGQTIGITTHIHDKHGDNVAIDARFNVFPHPPTGGAEAATAALAIGTTLVTGFTKVVEFCGTRPVICAEAAGGMANG